MSIEGQRCNDERMIGLLFALDAHTHTHTRSTLTAISLASATLSSKKYLVGSSSPAHKGSKGLLYYKYPSLKLLLH